MRKIIIIFGVLILMLAILVSANIQFKGDSLFNIDKIEVKNITTIDNATELRIMNGETLETKAIFNDVNFGGRTTFTGSMMNNDDINDSSRFVERNINNGSFAASVFTVRNDIPFSASFGLTSNYFSYYDIGPNEAGISSVAPGKMNFMTRYNYPFVWYINKNNDSSVENLTQIMNTTEYGLNIDGNIYASGNASINSYLGEMYIFNNSDTQTLTVQNVWYNITNFVEGTNKGFTFTPNVSLTAQVAGLYKIEYSFSFSGAKDNYYMFNSVTNGNSNDNCRSKRLSDSIGDIILL